MPRDANSTRAGTSGSGQIGLTVQLYPEFKIRPNVRADVARDGKGRSASSGYLTKTPRASGGSPRPDEGVPAGQLYYRPSQTNSTSGTQPDDDDDSDDNAKGGLIRKVKGPKPKGSKDDGKITAQRGEFVIKKAAVQKRGVAALNALNAGRARIVKIKSATRRK